MFEKIFESQDFLTSLNISLIAALLIAIIAASVDIFFKSKQKTRDEVEGISNAVKASAAEAQALAFKAILEKIPAEASKEEIEGIIRGGIQIGGDLIISQNQPEERQLVEDLVTNYHHQALSQARFQFWFSVFAATAGFLYILYGASQADSADFAAFIKILPGVVVDVIAALFFRQAEQTRQRATELYDRLRTDKQMMRAEAVVNTIEDLSIRSAVKAQIALHMVGLSPKEIDLQSFMSKASTPEQGSTGAR